jgi:small-conductance mechanosensitive channel
MTNTQHVAAPPMKNPIDLVVAKLHDAANGFFLQLPNIVGGLVFLLICWFIARMAARGVRRLFQHRDHADLGNVLGSIAFGFILILALLVAAAIVFPSVQPGNIISTLGIGSVAIGFAFKDILQNLASGILILINRPFRRGDQIKVKDYEGTVEHIQSRATAIKTYDGRRVIIPNSDIYTSPVTVNTAFATRRDQFDVGIGYGDDPVEAGRLFAQAVAALPEVEDSPAAEALAWGLDDNYVTLRVRWWVKSMRTELVHTRAKAILAIFKTAAEHGIDLPFPTTTLLFHDQTDAADGDRSRQREGWPAGRNPPPPRRTDPMPEA